ncbi:hypothetical protein [Nesterenkonia ebinurensis]|uniref:hypothetical protein n=1 Tax=Nesterenkonia ebinurensis TaxID=2608252 RepID=UPI00123CE535|nr:hypothetical protein [Nesterenkonia ebinurensis]
MTVQPVFEDDYVLPKDRQWRGVFDQRLNATEADIERTLGLIKRSDITAELHQWMEQDRIVAAKHAGPGPSVDFASVLAIFLTLACAGQAQTIRNAATLIKHGLSEQSRRRLGIEIDEDTTGKAIYDRIDGSLHRLLDTINPEPGPRGKRLLKDELEDHRASITKDTRAKRWQRLHQVCNTLLVQCFRDLPRHVRRRWKGNAVVDGTVLPVHSRATRRKSKWASTEWEAGWYKRQGDHFLDSDAPSKELSKAIYGYDAAIVSMATNNPSRETTFPQLAVGMSMDKPAKDPGPNAIIAISHMHQAGLPAGTLIGDRAYGNSPLAENFQIPAREMGYQLLFDMKQHDIGKVHDAGHFIVLEGNFYSPGLRGKEALINASYHYRVDKSIDYDTWQKRLHQRAKHMLQPHEATPRPGGGQQMRCPASGPNPTVDCPLRPRDLEAETGKQLTLLPIMPKNVPAEHTRGGLCTNAGGTQIIRGPIYDREAMDPRIQYGTGEWHSWYSHARNTIESLNASAKNGAGSALANPDRRRVRGVAANYLFAALALIATNMRKTERYMAQNIHVDSRGRGPERKDKPRLRDLTWGAEQPKPWNRPPKKRRQRSRDPDWSPPTRGESAM